AVEELDSLSIEEAGPFEEAAVLQRAQQRGGAIAVSGGVADGAPGERDAVVERLASPDLPEAPEELELLLTAGHVELAGDALRRRDEPEPHPVRPAGRERAHDTRLLQHPEG